VAIGMVIATRLGEKLKITKEGTTQRLISLLNRFSLPTSTTLDVMYGIDSDKKAEGKQISIVSLQEIGKVMGLSLTIDRLKDIIGDL
jgi:3-dehydroquinate synthetase